MKKAPIPTRSLRFILPVLVLAHVTTILGQKVDSIRITQQTDSLVKIYAKNILNGIELENTIAIFDSMRELVELTIGKCNWAYVKCNFWSAEGLINLGRYWEAEIKYTETKTLQEQCVGTKWIYGQVLFGLEFIYEETNRLALAQKTMLAHNEYFKTWKRPYFDIAINAVTLGRLYRRMGYYKESKVQHLRADSIFKANQDSLSNQYILHLIEFGNLYRYTNDLDTAKAYLQKALQISEIPVPDRLRFKMGVLSSIATVYGELGDYRNEEITMLEYLGSMEQIFGKDSYPYAIALNQYAYFLMRMGRYAESRNILNEAQSIMESAGYTEIDIYAEILLTTNEVLANINPELEKPEDYYRARDILLKRLGPQSQQYANSLLYIMNYLLRTENFKEAEALIEEVKQVLTAIEGQKGRGLAKVAQNSAWCNLGMSHYEQALADVINAKSIVYQILSDKHTWYIDLLALEAEIRRYTGDRDLQYAIIKQYTEEDKALINSSITYLTEEELSDYITVFEERLNLTNRLVSLDINQKNELVAIAYDQALFYKGVILYSVMKWRSLMNAEKIKSPDLSEKQIVLRQLNSRYFNAILAKDTVLVEELNRKTKAMHKEIMNEYAINLNLPNPSYKEVIQHLDKDAAAIEFVEYDSQSASRINKRMLGALILTQNSVNPDFIELCAQDTLASMLMAKGMNKSESINTLYEADASIHSSAYELFWRPLEPYLKSKKKVFVSKSGILHRINIGAMQVNKNKTIADQYTIVNVNSTRDILNWQDNKFDNITGLLVGGISYDLNPIDSTASVNDISMASNSHDSELRGLMHPSEDWTSLPGTIHEIDAISKLLSSKGFNYTVFEDTAATELKIKEVGNKSPEETSPTLIHFSTHGYFFPDKKEVTSSAIWKNEDPIFKTSEHPLIRSGLILAGGNYAWKHGHPFKPGMEDGILTAYEISQMDLSNTELVVLSACETGLGDIKGNEGVYGLQRAFKIAGVKNLIMSLWKVPDAATAELMISFYKHWLEDKMTIRQALYTAQKELRDDGFEPFYWAGWVLVE